MFSTSDAAHWLRAGVSQAQTVARRATAVAIGTATSRSSSSTASSATGSDTTDAAANSGDPDVSRFAPGGDQFRQPDQTTCGSSSLVMAKMINTPDYGSAILQPGDDATIDPDAVTQRFDQAVLAMHAVSSGWKDSAGGWQLPWPAQLGTAPWAIARQMSAVGGSGVAGTSYRWHLVNPFDAGGSYTAITAAVDAGQCVPLFIGNDLMARHVVLVTGHTDDDGLSIYDPSSGRWVAAARDGYLSNNIDIAGWGQPWITILPA